MFVKPQIDIEGLNIADDVSQRNLSSLELPRAVAIATGLSSPISDSRPPSYENQERIELGTFDGSASLIQHNGRQRQKFPDLGQDISIQLLDKFSLVTTFAWETTSQLFRDINNDVFGANERRNHDQTPHPYPSIVFSNDVEEVPNEIPIAPDPLEVKTSVFLQRIGVLDRSAATSCLFCNSQQETVQHVLIHCPLVWQVWTGLLQWWGILWVVPASVEDLLHWWAGFICKKKERRIWPAIPLVTLWSIWKIRNECLFQASHLNTQLLQELIILRLAFWLKSSYNHFPFSINDFLFNASGVRHCIRT